jgi:urease accessory protein
VATVRLVSSAAAPLAGDDLELTVHIGSKARLILCGVAATLALPGHRFEPSRFTVRLTVEDGASIDYHPEPTVITGRARHESLLRADLGADAVLRFREVLVLGRAGEQPGRLAASLAVVREGRPLLRQRLEIGDPALDASAAYLAGHKVLATELVLDGSTLPAAGGQWWARTPLAAGGWMCTALAPDAVTAIKCLDSARPAD